MKLSSLCRRLGFICPLHGGRLCHNAERSLRDASQASWQSRVFGYLGDCFSRCCSSRNDITTQPEGVGGGCQSIQGAQRNPAYLDCPSRNPCHFHLRRRRTNQKRSFNYLIDDVIIYWGIEKEDVFSSFAHEIKRTRPLFDDSFQFTILLKPEPSFPGFPLLLRPFPLRPLPKRAHRADFLL